MSTTSTTNPFQSLEDITGAEPRTFVGISRYINVPPSLHIMAMRPHTFPGRPATRRRAAMPATEGTAPIEGIARQIPEGATLEDLIAMGESLAIELAANLARRA